MRIAVKRTKKCFLRSESGSEVWSHAGPLVSAENMVALVTVMI